jgi:DNA (cytosine-5)-methyltransferase 1
MTMGEYGLIIDNFAGGGGASEGIRRALGRGPDVAINHDPEAVAMHAANHPETEHYCQSVWRADPRDVVRGRPVALAWFSPDCKHFSKAKGGKPVEKHIRDLAWVVVHWARLVKPRVMILENVEEFRDWGPLIETKDGVLVPCPERKGLTFRRWVREIRKEGYAVEWRELRASDYGAPTIRKRLFVIARRDGKPIVWPEPTHGTGLLSYRTAAECIDWSIPCPSIFERDKPLAEATMRRIFEGIRRYVVDAVDPFIVPITHAGDSRVHPIDDPLRTVTTAHRGELALVEPFVAGCGGRASQSPPKSVGQPFNTATTKADQIFVAPYLVPRYGERPGQVPRTHAVDKPMPVVVPTANGGSLVVAHMEQANTGMVGHDARKPLSTIVSRGTTQRLVTSHLVKLRGTCKDGQDVHRPMPTITAGGWHIGEVRAFLMKYYSSGGQLQSLREPMHTTTAKARMGLVTVRGEAFQIVDIGMRMLAPRELFRAQGFGDSYIINPLFHGKPLTKTAQIRMCGNSVCPPIAEALVRANVAMPQEEREVA